MISWSERAKEYRMTNESVKNFNESDENFFENCLNVIFEGRDVEIDLSEDDYFIVNDGDRRFIIDEFVSYQSDDVKIFDEANIQFKSLEFGYQVMYGVFGLESSESIVSIKNGDSEIEIPDYYTNIIMNRNTNLGKVPYEMVAQVLGEIESQIIRKRELSAQIAKLGKIENLKWTEVKELIRLGMIVWTQNMEVARKVVFDSDGKERV